ncbi:MAG TPA: hypothetical protein VGI40_08960 [Pirellulaceae bacterium]|jgi:hypothetical protein
MAHFIRLRGTWETERVGEPNNPSSIRLTRRFGCSAGLKSAQCVWLAIEDVVGRAAVALNGTSLGEIIGGDADDDSVGKRCPAKFVITPLLQPRNALTVEIFSADGAIETARPENLGLVQLEIE